MCVNKNFKFKIQGTSTMNYLPKEHFVLKCDYSNCSDSSAIHDYDIYDNRVEINQYHNTAVNMYLNGQKYYATVGYSGLCSNVEYLYEYTNGMLQHITPIKEIYDMLI